MTKDHAPLPTILAGPLLRRVDNQSVSVWLVSSSRLDMSIQLREHETQMPEAGEVIQRCIQIGLSAFVNLLTFTTQNPARSLKNFRLKAS